MVPGEITTPRPPTDTEEDWSHSAAHQDGIRRWAPLRGPHQSSNRSELLGGILALQWQRSLRLLLDSSYVAAGFSRILQQRSGPTPKPWALLPNGDLWEPFEAIIQARGVGTALVLWTKGHASR